MNLSKTVTIDTVALTLRATYINEVIDITRIDISRDLGDERREYLDESYGIVWLGLNTLPDEWYDPKFWKIEILKETIRQKHLDNIDFMRIAPVKKMRIYQPPKVVSI